MAANPMKAKPLPTSTSFSKLDKAKTHLILDHAFMATILMNRELVARNDIRTMAVDRRGTIYYNPAFVEGLSVPQIIWGLAHECSHWVYQHFNRQGPRDQKKWNYACDAVINDLLDAEKLGERIPNTVNMPGSKDKSSEQVYAELPDDDGGGGKGKGSSGPGSDWGDTDGMGSDFLDEGRPLTEDEQRQLEQQARAEVAEALNTAKMKGNLSKTMQEFAEKLIASKVPWYDLLERFMVSLTRGEVSWARPNRKYIGQRLYLPSVGKIQQMGRVGLLVDVSGSISRQEVAHYNGHIKRLIELCYPEAVHIAYCDTDVTKDELFENDLSEVEVKFYSGGGTDMPAGLDWFAETGEEYDVVVVLTDGYTNWPTKQYDFPVIWCISTDQKAPESAGITIPFEVEEK